MNLGSLRNAVMLAVAVVVWAVARFTVLSGDHEGGMDFFVTMMDRMAVVSLLFIAFGIVALRQQAHDREAA